MDMEQATGLLFSAIEENDAAQRELDLVRRRMFEIVETQTKAKAIEQQQLVQLRDSLRQELAQRTDDLKSIRSARWTSLSSKAQMLYESIGDLHMLRANLACCQKQLDAGSAQATAVVLGSSEADPMSAAMSVIRQHFDAGMRREDDMSTAADTGFRLRLPSSAPSKSAASASPSTIGTTLLAVAGLFEKSSAVDVVDPPGAAQVDSVDLQEEVEGLRQSIAVVEAEYAAIQQLHDTVDDALTIGINETKAAGTAARDELLVVMGDLGASRAERRAQDSESLRAALGQLRSAEADGDQQRLALNGQIGVLNRNNSRLEDELEKCKRDLEDCRAEVRDSKNKLQQANQKAAGLADEVAEIERKNKGAERARKLAEQDVEDQEQLASQLQKDNVAMRQALQQAEDAATKTDLELSRQAAELDRLRARAAERDVLADQLHVAEGNLRERAGEIDSLRAKVSAQAAKAAAAPKVRDESNDLASKRLAAVETELYDTQARLIDAEGETDRLHRQVAAVSDDLRRKDALIDDLKSRADIQIRERAALLRSRDESDSLWRDSERQRRDLASDLQESKALAAFLEGRVNELMTVINAQNGLNAGQSVSDVNEAAGDQLKDAFEELAQLRAQLGDQEAEAARRRREVDEAHEIELDRVRSQVPVLKERVSELERQSTQLKVALDDALTGKQAAEIEAQNASSNIATLKSDLSLALRDLSEKNSKLEAHERADTLGAAEALQEARKKTKELEDMIETLKPANPTQKVLLSHRGLSLSDNEDPDNDNVDGDTLKTLALKKKVDAMAAENTALKARLQNAEYQYEHAKRSENADIELLRKHAQVEAEKLMETNHVLHQRLAQKERSESAATLLKVAFLTAENKKLKRALKDKMVGLEYRKRYGKGHDRFGGEGPSKVYSATCWDTPPAARLGLAEKEVEVSIDAQRNVVIAVLDTDREIAFPLIGIKRIGLDGDVVSVEVGSAGGANMAGMYFFSSLKAARVFRMLERLTQT